jgi:Zn-dependent protease
MIDVVSPEVIVNYALLTSAALPAVVFHEIAHGVAALKLGDTTAKERGRLSLNPIRHIDLVGLLVLIVAGFGWAKPVPVDSRYFKNPHIGMAIVAFAGPAINLIWALICTLTCFTFLFFDFSFDSLFVRYFMMSAMINIGLGIFNLFPIPPLDGSKMLGVLLPVHIHTQILRYEKYGMFVLIILLWTGVLSGPLGFLRGIIFDLYARVGLWFIQLLSQVTGG